MTEQTERIGATCPACSPEFETAHEVLSGGGRLTVRCTECDHVHQTSAPDETTVERSVVVSQDGESFTATVEGPPDDVVGRGQEFVLETDDALMEVRITDVQTGDERRVEEAPFEDVDTLWTRAVGNVSVPVTVNPKEGEHDGTRGVEVYVPGDYEFEVGETESFGDEEFTVKKLLLRDVALGYDRQSLEYAGDAAPAKDIKRVYAIDETSDAWSAW